MQMLQISDTAREKLKTILAEHPGKCLAIVSDGFG
jgi:hypothetical protein